LRASPSARPFGRLLTSRRSWCSRRSAAPSFAVLILLAAAQPASPHPGHAPIEVDIANHAFAPQNVQIYQGDSIIFTWKGPDTNHSATGDNFDSDAGKQPTAVFHTIGDTYAVTFNDVGTFNYHCKVHPSMTGTVTVQAVAGPPTPVAPKLSSVSARPTAFRARTTVRLTLDSPASVRAILRRGTKTLKEVDFLAHPGQNAHRVNFGRKLEPGKAVLRVVAVDQTSGLSSKTASIRVAVKR
jgi:plastocyanin